jgi:hypothetical protein
VSPSCGGPESFTGRLGSLRSEDLEKHEGAVKVRCGLLSTIEEDCRGCLVGNDVVKSPRIADSKLERDDSSTTGWRRLKPFPGPWRAASMGTHARGGALVG